MLHPRIPLKGHHSQIPNAGVETGGRDILEFERVLESGNVNMVVQFIFIRPPINENKIGGSPLMDTKEAYRKMSQIAGNLIQPSLCYFLCLCNQLWLEIF